MSSKIPFTISGDAITMIVRGKPVVLGPDHVGFQRCAQALIAGRFDEAVECSTPRGAIKCWHPDFSLSEDGKEIYRGDDRLPSKLINRILLMCRAGEDPAALFAFWQRLAQNPSARSKEQLYDFLENQGIPIARDGRILAYKAVRPDFLDYYTGQIDNSPGQIVRMPRDQVCDDPKRHCAPGLHVGSMQYASTYGESSRKMVICAVDPADVVSVPSDSSCRKMRTCRYEVIGLHGGQEMSSTVHHEDLSDDDAPTPPPQEEGVDPTAEPCSVRCLVDKRCSGCASTQEEKPPAFVIPRRYEKYASMDAADLLQLPLEYLRELAGKAFRIVGASKVRGGKLELVRLIEAARLRL